MVSSSSNRGRKAAVFVGLGTLLVVVLVLLLFWKELAVRYHLYRLRGEPAVLARMLQEGPSECQELAIRKWIAHRRAKERFFQEYLTASLELVQTTSTGLGIGPGPLRGDLEGFLVLKGRLYFWLRWDGGGGHRDVILDESLPRHRLLRSASRFLTALRGEEFVSETNPGWRFRLLPGDEGARSSGFYVSWEKNHTVGRVDSGPRPPSWVSTGDVDLLKDAIMLLAESAPE